MIPTQPFGRTGHQSSRTIFGAAALGGCTQEVADQALQVLFDNGINHIDTAASYGAAEDRIGPWMEAGHRSKFFLATKTGQRTYEAARDEIRRSLERMKVDEFDLIQLHNLADPGEWETAMGDDGALRACIEAREAGLVKFIGVTGHGLTIPQMHLRSLEKFAFDSVLLPYNFPLMSNPSYAADVERLLGLCGERGVAVQTIKSVSRRQWGETKPYTTTWYEPLTEQPDIDRAAWWVLGNEQVFLNTASDVNLLPKILDAASRFSGRPSDAQMSETVGEREMAPLFTS